MKISHKNSSVKIKAEKWRMQSKMNIIVEIKSESQAQNEDNQNALSKTEEAKNIKLGGKQLNSKEESSAMKKVLQRK